jgi:lipopolysaccharide export LptBFGC system permease protein LptF
MSRTLFWYVLRDLLRIFLMTSGALAGIMSFGGLLRPLTEHGLDASQVSKMLTYFTPAMTTYSFPIAALFAATMVYGRLSADNELTACRAGGISYLSMTLPALVLGLTVALISLLFLCFVVPIFTLKVEQVIYSNLAQLVQNQIERTHQIDLGDSNVFAQRARVIPVTREMADTVNADRARKHQTANSGLQAVELTATMIVSYMVQQPPGNTDPNLKLQVAYEFWMAKRAIAYINQGRDDVQLSVYLENASKFGHDIRDEAAGPTTQPVKSKEATAVNVGIDQIGPMRMDSPIKEDAKFMTIGRLKAMYERPETSRRLQDQLVQLIKDEQASEYLKLISKAEDTDATFTFTDPKGEIVTIQRGELAGDLRRSESELVFQSKAAPDARQVKLTINSHGVTTVNQAMELSIRAVPQWDPFDTETEPTFDIRVDGFDVLIHSGEEAQAAQHKKFSYDFFDVAMPRSMQQLRNNTVNYYLKNRRLSVKATRELSLAQDKLLHRLESEIHSRASFAVSCLVLVMVGCALGMLFRSSNFLNAFAVSFIPAMLCIVLIVTGQQICNHAIQSMGLGLAFIWSGNVLVAGLAGGLLWKLHRT